MSDYVVGLDGLDKKCAPEDILEQAEPLTVHVWTHAGNGPWPCDFIDPGQREREAAACGVVGVEAWVWDVDEVFDSLHEMLGGTRLCRDCRRKVAERHNIPVEILTA